MKEQVDQALRDLDEQGGASFCYVLADEVRRLREDFLQISYELAQLARQRVELLNERDLAQRNSEALKFKLEQEQHKFAKLLVYAQQLEDKLGIKTP